MSNSLLTYNFILKISIDTCLSIFIGQVLTIAEISPSRMGRFISRDKPSRYICQLLHGESSLIIIVLLIILMYYFIMDIMLYVSLQNTNLFDQTRDTSYVHSPFHPLSVKQLMIDPAIHYLFCPIAEYFDYVTHFSNVFYFITPNMISVTHLFLGFVAARMVSSETLRTRRLAVILFEFRICLDCLDGVVFRSHSKMQIFRSADTSYGYLVDELCDILGGIPWVFGCLFFQLKCPPILKGNSNNEALPWTKNENVNGPAFGNHINHNQPARVSRKNICFKFVCVGTMLLLGVFTKIKTSQSYSALLETKMDNSLATVSFKISIKYLGFMGYYC